MKKLSLIVLLFIFSSAGFAQTIFSLRDDGTILKDNQPFFPMGFYIDRGTIASYKTMVDSLSAGGAFNLVNLPFVAEGNAAWTSFLDYCASKNIYVLTQLYYDGFFTGPISTFKDHPAIYGWSVADDADNGYFTSDQLEDRNTQIKAADPNHLSEISLTGYYASRRNDVDKYTPVADVSGLQIYPITPYPDYDVTISNALTQTYLRILKYVQSATKVNRPMIMTSQNFKWGSPAINPRYPTAAELRNMTYSGLAAGIKGISSYVLSPDLLMQTSLWSENKALRTDVTTLESAILNGTLTRVNTADPELVTSYWTNNEGIYIVVVNTSYTLSKTLSLPVPSNFGLPSESLFARMPNTLSFSAGTISGEIAPKEVEVYFLKNLDPDFEAPSVPTGLVSSSVSLTNFTLSWAASTDNYSVESYEVFKEGLSLGTTADTSMNITGLSYSSPYSMTVKATDAAGNISEMSIALVVTTAACTDTQSPSIPATLYSSAVNHYSFILTWSASTDNVKVTGYEVFKDGVSVGTTSTTKMDLTGLTCETGYFFTVKAHDFCNNQSDASSPLNVTTSTCVYEVENATVNGGVIQTDHSGYSGTGFWADVKIVGEYALFNVNSVEGGSTAITCRYSAGNGNQKMSLYVNGTKVKQTSFTKTTNWDTWANKVDTVMLNAGSNTIKFQYDATDNGTINIDYIWLAAAPDTQVPDLNGNEFIIYPNPSNSSVTIANVKPKTKITVSRIDGKIVTEQKVDGNAIHFDVTNWNKGVYLFYIETEKGVIVKKAIIK